MQQVDLIRGRIMRALREVSIYVSCLPIREQTALERLSDINVYARITDNILTELGHEPPTAKQQTLTQSHRKAQDYVPSRKGWPKGKPRKPKEAVETVVNTVIG